MKKRRSVLSVAVIAVLALTLAGCSIRIGWRSTSNKAGMSAHFAYFEGNNEKLFDLSAGDSMVIDYDISLEKGSLTILVCGPNGEVASDTGEKGTNTGRFSFDAPVSGRYTVRLTGDGAKGNYDISWNVEEYSSQ